MWGLPSIFIVYGAVAAPQVNSKLGKLLGDASYSIYLIQMLSIPVFYKLLVVLGIELNNDFLALACLIATAIAGTVMYLFIEKPMTHLIKTRLYAE